MKNKMKTETATFGGGCFWCIEAVIQRLKGVHKVVPGYAGGNAPGIPTYREVCSGLTGHAEVVQVTFDPDELSYYDLITVFMTSHDPTTPNRQGADKGTQYRSVILYHSQEQKETCLKVFDELKSYYMDPIVTELVEYKEFHLAEEDHHNYYNNNPGAGYCRVVIQPKIAKLQAMYTNKLKQAL
jgi:peptide-methionine (S)-S-oxide reductase